jgi:hypothetical protein
MKIIRDERNVEFEVSGVTVVTSYSGTQFVPNYAHAKVINGRVVSISVSKMDKNGWGIDDPAGPDGAELHADFGGGEFDSPESLPALVREILTAVSTGAERLATPETVANVQDIVTR